MAEKKSKFNFTRHAPKEDHPVARCFVSYEDEANGVRITISASTFVPEETQLSKVSIGISAIGRITHITDISLRDDGTYRIMFDKASFTRDAVTELIAIGLELVKDEFPLIDFPENYPEELVI